MSLHCKHVIALSISECTLISSLPTALLALSHLKDLDLKLCKSAILSREGWENLPQLTRLHLSGNHKLVSLPEQLSQLQKLQSLHFLSNHGLSGELPAWIFSLTDLTSLCVLPAMHHLPCNIPLVMHVKA
ncbi:unnamed protein product [Closterium sp. Yama58-4]|nr:unnamed protein product [Closterium sp. Yama58-4]